MGGNKEKKQEKLVNNSITPTKVSGTNVTILRVRDADIKSKAKNNIIKLQNRLDGYAELCKNNAHLNIPKKDSDIYNIQVLDGNWPTEYYENELKAYKKYELKLVQKEELHTKDSIAAMNTSLLKKSADSIALINKNQTPPNPQVQKAPDYHFVNKAFAIVRESQLENSKTLGVLYVGSYVKIIDPSEKSQYIKIAFQNTQGFIDKSVLVDDINKIIVPNADFATYKKSVYCRYIAKP